MPEGTPGFESQFPPEELEPFNPLEVDLGPHDRALQVFTYYNSRVVWFAIMQQTFVDGHWVDVARIDSCHSEAHVHEFRRGSEDETRRLLSVLGTIEDVERAFDEACDRLLDEWEQERVRWSR